MRTGFYLLDAPDLLRDLGISREDCSRADQRRKAYKKLEKIGIPVHNQGGELIVKQEDIDNWLENLSPGKSITSVTPKHEKSKTFAD